MFKKTPLQERLQEKRYNLFTIREGHNYYLYDLLTEEGKRRVRNDNTSCHMRIRNELSKLIGESVDRIGEFETRKRYARSQPPAVRRCIDEWIKEKRERDARNW